MRECARVEGTAVIEIALAAPVLASLIAACASLMVALVTAVWGELFRRRSNERMAELTAALTEAQKERDAQRDYRYEAEKRLYTDLQPLLFQLSELCVSAYRHTRGLARTARQGHLGFGDESWIDGDTYYLRSTIYRLIVPLAAVQLIRRRLTFVDLSIASDIRTEYHFARALSGTWNSGFDIAAAAPVLEYRPHDRVTEELMRSRPATFALQHLYAGQIDQIVGTLLIKDDQGLRYRGYGEFEAAYVSEDDVRGKCAPAVELFTGFHPRTKPVLWRMLVVQAHLHQAIARTFEEPEGVVDPIGILRPDEREFDWREPGAAESEFDVTAPFSAANEYLGAVLHAT
jgi:hypothetical protein